MTLSIKSQFKTESHSKSYISLSGNKVIVSLASEHKVEFMK